MGTYKLSSLDLESTVDQIPDTSPINKDVCGLATVGRASTIGKPPVRFSRIALIDFSESVRISTSRLFALSFSSNRPEMICCRPGANQTGSLEHAYSPPR
jgi:hypothetical protein